MMNVTVTIPASIVDLVVDMLDDESHRLNEDWQRLLMDAQDPLLDEEDRLYNRDLAKETRETQHQVALLRATILAGQL